MKRRELTPEEALAIILKRREYQRKYHLRPEVREKQREYHLRPEVREKQREHQRKYQRKIAAGYAAAKKAGLI